jgi:hypothetical protein
MRCTCIAAVGAPGRFATTSSIAKSTSEIQFNKRRFDDLNCSFRPNNPHHHLPASPPLGIADATSALCATTNDTCFVSLMGIERAAIIRRVERVVFQRLEQRDQRSSHYDELTTHTHLNN